MKHSTHRKITVTLEFDGDKDLFDYLTMCSNLKNADLKHAAITAGCYEPNADACAAQWLLQLNELVKAFEGK